jgi:cytochrome P450
VPEPSTTPRARATGLFRGWDGPARPVPAVTTVADHVGVPHVVVARHDLVRRVLADPETFRPDNALDAVTPIPVAALRTLVRHGFRLPPTLANNGGPSHAGIRAIVAEALHPDRVGEQRGWLTGVVRRRVAGLAARLRAGEPVDLYAGLAADLPLRVLARLVELPDSDAAVVKEFSRAALELFWAPLDPARQAALAETVGRYHAVLRRCAAEAGGMVGRLRAHARTQRLPPDTVVGALFFLLVAGQETTSQFLTLLLHRLLREPAVLAGLADGVVTVDEVVEEGLRLEPPIVTWRRVAGRDTAIGDVPVPAGTSVVLWLAHAGRDPAVAAAPERFAPGQRGSRRHLAFGAGAHRCLGAQLARMEAAVVVAETAPLLRRVEVVRAPWCPDNLSFRMPDALVVTRAAGQATSSAQTRQSSSTP